MFLTVYLRTYTRADTYIHVYTYIYVHIQKASNYRPELACCHPRLLQQKLMDLDLWSDSKLVMISCSIKNYKSWRQCLADCMDITLEDAKVELISLF